MMSIAHTWEMPTFHRTFESYESSRDITSMYLQTLSWMVSRWVLYFFYLCYGMFVQWIHHSQGRFVHISARFHQTCEIVYDVSNGAVKNNKTSKIKDVMPFFLTQTVKHVATFCRLKHEEDPTWKNGFVFLHRFCVRDLSGFVGNLCMLFFHVFARIIWLVLKVNQHVFHVGLGQFDNFW